jgi:hypothetical protein
MRIAAARRVYNRVADDGTAEDRSREPPAIIFAIAMPIVTIAAMAIVPTVAAMPIKTVAVMSTVLATIMSTPMAIMVAGDTEVGSVTRAQAGRILTLRCRGRYHRQGENTCAQS